MKVVADSLRFPEGPVWLPDGSVVLVEVRRGTLTRVMADGRTEVVAALGGGPNGAALGPDGHIYVCNNGGFTWTTRDGHHIPSGPSADYRSGRIERVSLSSGRVEVLYDNDGMRKLRSPNDLVFDAHGGFWFTDLGQTRARDADRGAVCYAKADGSMVREVIFPLIKPNGIGLSPDGRTLYVAETDTARLWAWEVVTPGVVEAAPGPTPHGGRLLYASPNWRRFDSLAVEASGNICVATLDMGGITVCAPTGGEIAFVPIADRLVTNLCFGGPALGTAWVTAAAAGHLLELPWPRPGLPLNCY